MQIRGGARTAPEPGVNYALGLWPFYGVAANANAIPLARKRSLRLIRGGARTAPEPGVNYAIGLWPFFAASPQAGAVVVGRGRSVIIVGAGSAVGIVRPQATRALTIAAQAKASAGASFILGGGHSLSLPIVGLSASAGNVGIHAARALLVAGTATGTGQAKTARSIGLVGGAISGGSITPSIARAMRLAGSASSSSAAILARAPRITILTGFANSSGIATAARRTALSILGAASSNDVLSIIYGLLPPAFIPLRRIVKVSSARFSGPTRIAFPQPKSPDDEAWYACVFPETITGSVAIVVVDTLPIVGSPALTVAFAQVLPDGFTVAFLASGGLDGHNYELLVHVMEDSAPIIVQPLVLAVQTL